MQTFVNMNKRQKGRKPNCAGALITANIVECKAAFCRAVMRVFIKLIKTDDDLDYILSSLLVTHGYPENSYQIIRDSALTSKTMYHKMKRRVVRQKLANPKLVLLFKKVRYRYTKKEMETLFKDERLYLIFKHLAEKIKRYGHTSCENR